MTIDIITLFPDMFTGPFDNSIVKRAQEKDRVTINIHNLRNWAIDKRGTVDDHPYGGGTGMLLRPEPLFNAVSDIQQSNDKKRTANNEPRTTKTILLDAGGELYTQKKAQEYSEPDNIILICGHYEGVDYRVHKHLADDVISIGDFVVTGGEIPAMLITDSIIRLIPGVLKKEDATQNESFSLQGTGSKQRGASALLEYPQYTRPEVFNEYRVPDILLSGHHAEIKKWQQKQARNRTKKNRPDLVS